MERGAACRSVGAYMAAEMMCLPGHKGWKDRRAVRLVAAARRGQKYLLRFSQQLSGEHLVLE
jgi:hypothetical protein